jgi:hypothetical protein
VLKRDLGERCLRGPVVALPGVFAGVARVLLVDRLRDCGCVGRVGPRVMLGGVCGLGCVKDLGQVLVVSWSGHCLGRVVSEGLAWGAVAQV